MKYDDLIESAEAARKEMIREGVKGWPNTLLYLSLALCDQQARIERLEGALREISTMQYFRCDAPFDAHMMTAQQALADTKNST